MFNNYNQEEQKKKTPEQAITMYGTCTVYKIKCKFYPLKEWN